MWEFVFVAVLLYAGFPDVFMTVVRHLNVVLDRSQPKALYLCLGIALPTQP